MKYSKIVFVGPKQVELQQDELDETLQNNQVLVKVIISNISSGTERANLLGTEPNSIFSDALPVYPLQTGYSASGIVVKVGENVTRVKEGDRVSLVWSKHSEYLIMDEENVHLIPYEDVTFEEAALSHISTFSSLSIKKCRLEFGESAIVMGLGVLGLLAVEFLKVAGAYPVIAVDPIEKKRQQALELGADYALNPYDSDFVEQVKNLTRGGVKVAIEVTGVGKALNQVLDCMKPFGRVALLGCTRKSDFTVDFYHKVHGNGVTLIGANTAFRPKQDTSNGFWTTRDEIAAFFDLIHGKRLDIKKLIEEKHSPKECKEVYDRLLTEPSFPVVQFDWRLL